MSNNHEMSKKSYFNSSPEEIIITFPSHIDDILDVPDILFIKILLVPTKGFMLQPLV